MSRLAAGRILLTALAIVSTLSAHPADTGYPLHTSGRWILKPDHTRVKLASANWSGAESPEHVVAGLDRARLADIARWIKTAGFNSVRLPWSNEMYQRDPAVNDAYLAANPGLKGKHALEIFDRVIDALGREGLMVVLDNHVSVADWCCSPSDGNAFWYTDDYPEPVWIAHWKGMAARYRTKPHVVGAELRNEVRPSTTKTPVWGGGDPKTDWAAAAERAGNAVLSANPNLLVIVGGINYQADLTGPYHRPIRLSHADKLVYAPHAYKWFADVRHGYERFATQLGAQWGYLLTQHQPYTAPVWVSEFGTCITWVAWGCDADDTAFSQGIQRYLRDGDIDWAYWQLNGTQSDSLDHGAGKPRSHGALDWYGLLNPQWNGPANAENVARIQALQAMTQHP
ncbi:glycoside hydrolase family 5 protein [Amycolatopsis sp. WGS_07]|uniref:glycoside hydrolase family 5 protein n=1 Tax=Amycolatopsis sp. WGS_07 TaxID=3076764 RepID=UPI003872F87F